MTHDPDERPVLAFAGRKSKPSRWTYRSAPYAWERLVMWVLIAACLGEGLAGRAFQQFIGVMVGAWP